MRYICIIILLLIAKPASVAYSGYLMQRAPVSVAKPSPSPNLLYKQRALRSKEQSGVLAYLSAGSALLGLAIASPGIGLVLIALGTAAMVSGKIGLKAYKGRAFLRVLCVAGLILGTVVLALGTVPIIFLTV